MKPIISSFYFSIRSNENIDRDILDIFQDIVNGTYEKEILEIRNEYKKPEKNISNDLKLALPCFMVSGTFLGTKKQENLVNYSQLIHLDYDYIPFEIIKILKAKILNLSTTFACFISPRGSGLKVFVKTNSNIEEHSKRYQEIRDFYNEALDFESDPSGANLNRACFISFDPELYLNIESEVFTQIEIPKTVQTKSIQMSNEKSIEECINFTNNICEYSPGNRNNYIYNLARNANRWGIDLQSVIDKSILIFDLNRTEIKATVNSAYKNENEFGKFAKSANFANIANIADFADFASANPKELTVKKKVQKETIDSPFIPQEVYDNLPQILKNSSDKFQVQRQKDIYLTSALAIISGCLPNVEGIYGSKKIFPNIFTLILAPASSGKSVMNFAIDLCRFHHSVLADISKVEKKDYEVKLQNYNQASDKSGIEIPEKPVRKSLIIPGNSSSSSIYQLLNNNEGSGIMIETEADTVGNVLKSDWGSFSEVLRKSFEHERLSQSRITNDTFIEIEVPKLSVTLSGTPNQIFNIMASAEDGLVSRFIYYYFEGEQKWKSQRPMESELSLSDFFEAQGPEVHKMIEFLKLNPTKFSFNKSQWDEHDRIFKKYTDEILKQFGSETDSIVKRMGQIFYRLAMILTTIRKFESSFKQVIMDCHPKDFATAKLLIETYIQHSLIVFKNLPSNSKNKFQSPLCSFDKVIQDLNSPFQRLEAVKVGEKYNLAERTVDAKLKQFVNENKLAKQKAGTYEKLYVD